MRYSKRRQKRLIIIGLLFVVFLMCIGYAAFSTVLTINSTSEITSAWDVEITNVRGVNDSSLTYNDAYDKVDPSISNDKLSVTIQTGLLYPGDTRIYEIEVTNKGNVDAQVTTLFNNVINDSTIFSFDGVSPAGSDGEDILSPGGTYNPSLLETVEPFDLPAFTNNKRYLYLMIKFKDNVTSQPKDLNPSVTLTLNAVQKAENTLTVPVGEETVSTHGLEIPLATSNDGLYEDDTEAGRYVYRGGNPNNYMTFNGETAGWRIIAFENDGTIKIIRNSSLVTKAFDDSGNRNNGNQNDYCSYAGGCSVWGSNKTMRDSNGLLINKMAFDLGGVWSYSNYIDQLFNLPNKEASINVFLNNDYYNTLDSKSKSSISSHIFNVGIIKPENATIYEDISQEKANTWLGNVGLINATDYVKSSIAPECDGLKTFLHQNMSSYGNSNCYSSNNNYNWISKINSDLTTINPFSAFSSSGVLLYFTDRGYIHRMGANNEKSNFFPVLYLKSNLLLKGTGGIDSPYYIDD